ncbi:hypothetical protein CHH51_01305 [Terribacillus saccharophilus]|nr:hypothetical protein CHH51_01305 [Terribacillus saccharophilus]
MDSTETFKFKFPRIYVELCEFINLDSEPTSFQVNENEGLAHLPNEEKLRFTYHVEDRGQVFIDGWTTLDDKQSQTPTYYGTGTTDPISYMKQHYTHEQLEGFLLGNIIKYATRANKKNGVEDYKKLAHYAQMLLEHAEGEMKG